MAKFQVLGVTDDKDFCQCCGRQGLKRVVFIENTETNEIKHFGTTCALAPAKGFNVDKQVKVAISRFEGAQRQFWSRVNMEYRRRGGQHVANPAKPGYFMPTDPALKDRVAAEFRAGA